MITEKTLAVLLAGLITLSLAGCAADKATNNTESNAVSTESRITATVTDRTSEPTTESSLPAGTESTTEYTTEKNKKAVRLLPTAAKRKPQGLRIPNRQSKPKPPR